MINEAENNSNIPDDYLDNDDQDDIDNGKSILHPGEQPLTTQGSEEEIEENLGGTTNLSLDQLKAERDPEGTPNQ